MKKKMIEIKHKTSSSTIELLKKVLNFELMYCSAAMMAINPFKQEYNLFPSVDVFIRDATVGHIMIRRKALTLGWLDRVAIDINPLESKYPDPQYFSMAQYGSSIYTYNNERDFIIDKIDILGENRQIEYPEKNFQLDIDSAILFHSKNDKILLYVEQADYDTGINIFFDQKSIQKFITQDHIMIQQRI